MNKSVFDFATTRLTAKDIKKIRPIKEKILENSKTKSKKTTGKNNAPLGASK